ncbi:hypothetical protein [Arthrobacter sp. H14-L1]|uniref:hypothetical protein n=1 Tax=Arthrobacter sp. H14-L1 TaxID=2996697 RepID=UPI00227175E3|nr:hypothetical protein [Arthrobacter sp. H14-L1]MCY0905386.1 hypothetical protein [Arthrobacter sp. H14-L1]
MIAPSAMVTWTCTAPYRVLALVPLKVPLTEALTPGAAAAGDGGTAAAGDGGTAAAGLVGDGVDVVDGDDGLGVDGAADDVPLAPPSAFPELPVAELPVGDPAKRAGPPVSDDPVPACQPSRMTPADAADAMMTARILTS